MFYTDRSRILVRICKFILPLVSLQGGKSFTSGIIALEGSLSDHDVRIGSTVNITCTSAYPKCGIKWKKDGKRLKETDRIEWVQGRITRDKQCTIKKLTIRNVTANDTGRYTCFDFEWTHEARSHPSSYPGTSISIHAVTCFQGYYCPLKDNLVKRCPTGTFTTHKNATSIDHCQVCPTRNKDVIRKEMEGITAAVFLTNCPDSSEAASEGTEKLSTGQKIALGISVSVVCAMLVLAVLCGVQRRRNLVKYEKKLFCPPKDVELDSPTEPRLHDVFVCYSSKNRQWVHGTLVANLKAQGFRTFVDFTDFEAGLAIQDNIINGIYGSRKTIFVLSKDSLKSFYARTELHQALVAGRTGHEVIVILYEKCKLPAEVTHIVYLDWTEEENREQFWEKLYRGIRRPLVNETRMTCGTP